MSTILNALKRLEKEHRTEDVNVVPATMTGHKPIRGGDTRQRRRPFLAGLAVFLAAGGMVWAYSVMSDRPLARMASTSPSTVNQAAPAPLKKSETTHPETTTNMQHTRPRAGGEVDPHRMAPTAHRKVDVPPSTRPAKVVMSSFEPNKKVNASANALAATPESAHPPQAIHRNPAPRADGPKAPSPPLKAAPGDPARHAPPAQQVKTNPPEAGNRKPLPAKAVPSASPRRIPYAQAEPLARGTLMLQAISWSDTPSARITVIGGRILREGQTVDGYTVVQIRPEDIIVGKGGTFWKLGYDGR